jgi:hypothetical protein
VTLGEYGEKGGYSSSLSGSYALAPLRSVRTQ